MILGSPQIHYATPFPCLLMSSLPDHQIPNTKSNHQGSIMVKLGLYIPITFRWSNIAMEYQISVYIK